MPNQLWKRLTFVSRDGHCMERAVSAPWADPDLYHQDSADCDQKSLPYLIRNQASHGQTWQWVQGAMRDAENGQGLHCHSPSPSHLLTVKFNPVFKLIGVFCHSASSGSISDPAYSNRPGSLFHFQTEAIPEHSSPFVLSEQLVTPVVPSLSLIIILTPNVCCTNGDHYHPTFPQFTRLN